jgi:rsbT co-antagonist protein RsbR
VPSKLATLIEQNENELLDEWVKHQKRAMGSAAQRISEGQLRSASQQLLGALRVSLQQRDAADAGKDASLQKVLAGVAHERLTQGFSPSETAIFVFSLKESLFDRMQRDFSSDPALLAKETWNITRLLDDLGLYTFEMYQKGREEVIRRQQQELLELSTPVVELWEGILALPLIGTLDSERTQIVMQNLLDAIVAKSADLAIIDITGVPTVDTLVAQHLLKTVSAARLMGADCIISGIRPQIAQTIIHLGVELQGVVTKASLSGAFAYALQHRRMTIVKI